MRLLYPLATNSHLPCCVQVEPNLYPILHNSIATVLEPIKLNEPSCLCLYKYLIEQLFSLTAPSKEGTLADSYSAWLLAATPPPQLLKGISKPTVFSPLSTIYNNNSS